MMKTLSADGRNTSKMNLLIRQLRDHWDARCPEDELKGWSAFDIEALSSDISLEHESTETTALAKKYEVIIHQSHSMEAMNSEYAAFKK